MFTCWLLWFVSGQSVNVYFPFTVGGGGLQFVNFNVLVCVVVGRGATPVSVRCGGGGCRLGALPDGCGGGRLGALPDGCGSSSGDGSCTQTGRLNLTQGSTSRLPQEPC